VKRRMLCVILALSLTLAIGSSPGRAETLPSADSAPPHGPAMKQPAFCFQGDAPDRQERSRYAERAQRDASRASGIRAGDRDETAFIIMVVLFSAAVVAGGVFLAGQGI
jgi:hypothetical protein